MSIELKFILFQILIILPFVIGFITRDRIKHRDDTAGRLVKGNLIFLEPGIVLWSIWGLSLSSELVVLPAAGLVLVLLGFLIGRLLLPLLKLRGVSVPTYLISSSLANHGFTMGGFICYIFMGERGLGLGAIFISYFMFYTYLFVFTYAAKVSGSGEKLKLKDLFINSRNMPLYAAIAGIALNLSGLSRPDIFFPFDYLLLMSVALYYYTLGINFYFRGLFPLSTEHFTLALSKFILLPLFTWVILMVSGISGDVKDVILIQSFMPAAVYSVVSSVLFRLDTKMAASLFFINTLIFILLILPFLFLIYGSAGISSG